MLRSRSGDRVLLAVIAAVFCVGVWLVASVFRGSGSSVSGSVDVTAADASTVVVGGGSDGGVVVGMDSPPTPNEGSGSESELGGVEAAQAAAVAAVNQMGVVVDEGRLGRRAVLREFTTAEFFSVFIDETNTSLAELDAASGVSVSEWVLRSSAEVVGDGVVEVSVWSVSVIVVDGEVRSMWRTVVLSMRDVGGVWLVDGWESFAGPSPGPGSGSVFASAVEMRSVAEWDRVG